MKLTYPAGIFSLLAALALPSHGVISVYISAPDVESAETSGLITSATIATENFSSLTAGGGNGSFPGSSGYVSTALGATYTTGGGDSGGSGSEIKPADMYSGDSEGNYLGVTHGSSVTITLDSSTYVNGAQYFGLYFTAGDAYNHISIYDGATLVEQFSTQALLAMLPKNSQVQAIDGSFYNTNSYYGQPNTGQNGGETYAYLHFIASAGTSFDRIVLGQEYGHGEIFENDNHSILATAPTLPGSLVLVPEPASVTLAGLGLGALCLRRRRQA